MKRLWIIGLAVTLAPGLWAQQPQAADTGEAGRLRAQIEQRFNDRVLEDLQLSPDQATKLRSTQEKFDAPHLVIFPAVAVMLAVLSFNFVGDALRDFLDPRSRIEIGL